MIALEPDREAVLFLRGEINERSATTLLRQLALIQGGRLRLLVDSAGGSVLWGGRLFLALREHPAHITAVVRGSARSMAATVIQAADVVLMDPDALLYIHNPSGGRGDVHEATAALLARSLTLRSGLPLSRVREWMSQGTAFEAAIAVALGLADGVAIGTEVVWSNRGPCSIPRPALVAA